MLLKLYMKVLTKPNQIYERVCKPKLLVVKNMNLIFRSVENIKRMTADSGLQLFASVADPSEDILDLLESHSFKIHSYGSVKRKPKSWLGRILPDLREMASKLFSSGVCQKDHLPQEIKFLHTGENTTRISTFRPTLANLTKKERHATYLNNPYNPMFRRAVLNSKGKSK